MPDPIALPLELWTWCISFAIDGRQGGPLELLGVSRRWDMLLLDTPSLWSQIYVQNGEDEIARIAVFLHLSRRCSLHVDIMTALPDMGGLQMIADNISRVTTISIRPSASDTTTALNMDRWKQVAAHNLATLSTGLVPSDVKCTFCLGMNLREYGQWYYCIVLMHFTMVATVANTDRQNGPSAEYSRLWEEYISRTTRISADQDFNARSVSVSSFGKLASYPQHHGAIEIAVPSCIKLLEDDDHSIRSATVKALHKLAVHVNLREALGLATPSFITLLENKDSGVVVAAVSLLRKLAEHGELHESLRPAIPSLIKLLGCCDSGVRSVAVSLLGQLSERNELHEALRLTIPSLIKLLERKTAVVLDTDSLFRKLSGHETVPELSAMPVFSAPLENKDSAVQLAAVSLLERLAEHDELHGALRLTIPLLVRLLEGCNRDSRSAAICLLGKFAEHGELRETLRLAIPSLIKLLERWDSGVRAAAVFLLGRLAEHDELCEALRLAIPSLIKLLGHWNSDVRAAAVSLFAELANHDELHRALRHTIPLLVEQLGSCDVDVRSAVISLLRKLAEPEEWHSYVM